MDKDEAWVYNQRWLGSSSLEANVTSTAVIDKTIREGRNGPRKWTRPGYHQRRFGPSSFEVNVA